VAKGIGVQIDTEKAVAELPILYAFIKFVNAQVGVYMDCLAGFQGNTARISRQVARVLHRTGVRLEKGQPVVMYASLEDPRSPEVIHQRIMRTDEFLAANREAGFNEKQVCWSIIVFLFTYWDEQVRPQIAAVRGVKQQDVKVDALGDLRIIRHAIIHNKGVLTAGEHAKLKKMAGLCRPGHEVIFDHDQMHKVFVEVKQAIAAIVLTYTGGLPGAPKASELVDIAIQNPGSRKP